MLKSLGSSGRVASVGTFPGRRSQRSPLSSPLVPCLKLQPIVCLTLLRTCGESDAGLRCVLDEQELTRCAFLRDRPQPSCLPSLDSLSACSRPSSTLEGFFGEVSKACWTSLAWPAPSRVRGLRLLPNGPAG